MKAFFKLTILIINCLYFSVSLAAEVKIADTYSTSMGKKIKAVIITPESYKQGNITYPVVYLLHGYGGNYQSWINGVPELEKHVDNFNTIIVCPDGNVGSWYFDSPIDPAWKYETYVSKELVKWVDTNYRTIRNRSGRGITGLSMGGHGALFLAFRHQDVFGTAGSMSGGVDFRPFPKNWEIFKRLGTLDEFPERWNENTVINLTGLVQPGALDLIIDCGTDDFFFTVNNDLHNKLLQNKIPHDYIVRPGAHNWPYWKNSVLYQLVFMRKFFDKAS